LTSISRNDCWASPNDEDYRSDVFSAFESAALRRLRTRICRTWSGSLLFGLGLDKYPHNVALLHYEVFDTIDLDLGARPFAEQDAVADLDVNRDELAALVAAPGANGGYLALLRFLLGGVGNDYTAGGLCLGFDALDDNAVVKRSEISLVSSCCFAKSGAFIKLIMSQRLFVVGLKFPDPLCAISWPY